VGSLYNNSRAPCNDASIQAMHLIIRRFTCVAVGGKNPPLLRPSFERHTCAALCDRQDVTASGANYSFNYSSFTSPDYAAKRPGGQGIKHSIFFQFGLRRSGRWTNRAIDETALAHRRRITDPVSSKLSSSHQKNGFQGLSASLVSQIRPCKRQHASPRPPLMDPIPTADMTCNTEHPFYIPQVIKLAVNEPGLSTSLY